MTCRKAVIVRTKSGARLSGCTSEFEKMQQLTTKLLAELVSLAQLHVVRDGGFMNRVTCSSTLVIKKQTQSLA